MSIVAEEYGLRTRDNAAVALRGVRYRSWVSALSHRTVVEQTYVNMERRAIEAVYTFPLPENAAVCGFEILLGDRVLTGTVEETDVATEKYDRAVREGEGAYLLDAERPDVFTVAVGNLKPRQAVTVRLTYVAELEVVDGEIRLAYPTTVAPRYVTSTGSTALDAAMADAALNPPRDFWVPYGLTMEVTLEGDLPLAEVTSPSHSLMFAEREDGSTQIEFAGDVAAMDRDVVLKLKLKRTGEPTVVAERGLDGAHYLAVTFHPEFEVRTETEPTEVCFVVDCSGSMEGESIEQATRALELCLRSLNEGDRFNVCRFGSSYK
ncbi:MAG TPA: VIT domain-containing protein, partial [Tepidisphaeraceae bacterium]